MVFKPQQSPAYGQRVRESLRRTGLQKLLQEREFIGQLIKLDLDLRVSQCFGAWLFMRQHFCTPSRDRAAFTHLVTARSEARWQSRESGAMDCHASLAMTTSGFIARSRNYVPARSSMACSSTLQPAVMCSGVALSISLWLMPSLHGMKIMPLGARRAM